MQKPSVRLALVEKVVDVADHVVAVVHDRRTPVGFQEPSVVPGVLLESVLGILQLGRART